MQILVLKMYLLKKEYYYKLNCKHFITYPLLQARAAPDPSLFFRIRVTQGASPDKDLSLAGRTERQRWKHVQGLWIVLVGRLFNRENKGALRCLWCLEQFEGKRDEQNIFRKCCFVY